MVRREGRGRRRSQKPDLQQSGVTCKELREHGANVLPDLLLHHFHARAIRKDLRREVVTSPRSHLLPSPSLQARARRSVGPGAAATRSPSSTWFPPPSLQAVHEASDQPASIPAGDLQSVELAKRRRGQVGDGERDREGRAVTVGPSREIVSEDDL